jgi:hypothetical protein
MVAGDEVQWGAVRELAQEEGVSIWGTGRREAHRWGRGTTDGGRHLRGTRSGQRTHHQILWLHGGRWLEGDSFPEEGLERTWAKGRGVLTWRLVGDIWWETLCGDWLSRGEAR